MLRFLKRLLLGALGLFALLYLAAAIMLALDDSSAPPFDGDRTVTRTIAIFGASGTAGDGILEAALADPDIATIHVITRRTTPRIDAGIAAGKVRMTLHFDYEDYAAVRDDIAGADAVYWALGTSSIGMDEETYARIHVDFPLSFVTTWLEVGNKTAMSFHYISSSDIAADSSAMWARQKYRAEMSLFEQARGTRLKVIAYRPDYIGPTDDEAHIGQDLLYWFFRPVGAAVRARAIGQAMLEVSARIEQFENGDRVGTRGIHRYSDAYVQSLR